MKKIYLIFTLSLFSGILFSQTKDHFSFLKQDLSFFSPSQVRETVVITKESYIYSKSHYEFKTATKLEKGTELEYLDIANEYYYKVSFEGRIRYVKRRYSKLVSSRLLSQFPGVDSKRPSNNCQFSRDINTNKDFLEFH